MTEYEKDLNELKEQILKEGDTLVSKKDLLERFCEMDEEYNGEPWNLLQILSNINILIGQEPCENSVSRDAVDHLCFEFLKANTDDNIAFYEHFRDLPPVVPKGVTVTDFADKCRECGKLRKKYNERN